MVGSIWLSNVYGACIKCQMDIITGLAQVTPALHGYAMFTGYASQTQRIDLIRTAHSLKKNDGLSMVTAHFTDKKPALSTVCRQSSLPLVPR